MSLSSLFSPDTMSRGADPQSQALAKPAFSETQASALVESVFGLKVSTIQPLPSYDDQNFRVCVSRAKDAADGPAEYVLKISNTESSRTPELIEVQSHIILFLRAAGFPTASVCRTKGDNLTSLVSVGKNPAPGGGRPGVSVTGSRLQAGVSRAGLWLRVWARLFGQWPGGHSVVQVEIRGSGPEVVRAGAWCKSSPREGLEGCALRTWGVRGTCFFNRKIIKHVYSSDQLCILAPWCRRNTELESRDFRPPLCHLCVWDPGPSACYS